MKLFQIEEPDGSPVDRDAPGAAVGIEVGSDAAAVAIALGGNAEILPDAAGNRRLSRVEAPDLGALFLALRSQAEKQLARPVTHAVIAASAAEQVAAAEAAGSAGLAVLRVLALDAAAAHASGGRAEDAAVLGAAVLAEDLAPPTG